MDDMMSLWFWGEICCKIYYMYSQNLSMLFDLTLILLIMTFSNLQENIEANKIIFLCIQIQCGSTWGLIPKIISKLSALKLEVIDNRSWHHRGVDSTLMTEIFVQDDCFLHITDEEAQNKSVDERIAEVNEAMVTAIRQPVS